MNTNFPHFWRNTPNIYGWMDGWNGLHLNDQTFSHLCTSVLCPSRVATRCFLLLALEPKSLQHGRWDRHFTVKLQIHWKVKIICLILWRKRYDGLARDMMELCFTLKQVSHEFPLNFNPANPFCAGMFTIHCTVDTVRQITRLVETDYLICVCVCRCWGCGGGLQGVSAPGQTLRSHQLLPDHQPRSLLWQASPPADHCISK